MSRKNGSDKVHQSWGKSRFINISLTNDQQQHCSELVAAEKLGMDDICRAVDDGFKFSVKRDDSNHSIVASLSYTTAGNNPTSIILTGRSATPVDAIYALLYKHEVITEGLWATSYDIPDELPRFG